MVKFKCKMCGYVLNVDENDTTVECEFCASKQTLPKMSAEKRLAYFNKGNDCRRLCDFDKALAYYKKLLEEDNTDPEVYWGILLCKYGVEYKESQQTFMMEPKIHRTQTTSIFDDKYYKLALKYASPEQKEIYEQDAKEISDKQNEVLEAAKTKAPVDVFICYKKLNEYSDTTVDSEIANLIYDELVMYDIKTFATGITLRDKKTDFEPYIYSALSSAKVMIVIGTKPDYLTDIWVKNEWNRYLKLIKNGEDKILIPVYKDINPEDYPKQFDDFESVNIDNLSNIVKVIKMVKEIFGKTEIVAKPAEEPADEMESIDNIVSEPAEDYSESSYEEPASYESESYETENYEQEPASDEPNYAQENSSEGYEKVDENVLNEIFAEPKKVETHSEPLEEKKATSQKPSYQDIMSNMFGSQAQTETKTAKTNIFDEKTAEKPGFSENTSTKPSFDEIINAKPSENETTRKPSFDEIVNAKPSVSETTRKPSFDEIVNAKPSASEVTPKETKVENKNQFSERKMQLIYDAAFDFIKLSRFVEAGKMFGKILDYKDSTKMYYRCINHDELVNKDNFYNKLVFEMNNISENETDVNKVQNLINRFTAIKDYRDVNQKIEELEQVKKKAQINYDNLLKETYTRLVSEIDDKNEHKVEAKRLGYLIEAFNEIYNYKDVPKIINELKEKQKQAEEDYKEYLAEKKRKKRKKIKKISILTSIFAIILGTIITLSITLFIPLYKYNKAEKLYNQGNYEEARNIYDDLDEFKNSWQRYAAINCIIFLNDNEDEYIIFYDSSYYYDSQFIK